MLLLIALACEATPLTVLPPSGSDTGFDDTGPAPEPHFAAGAYAGEMGYFVPEWDWEVCFTDEFTLDIDDEGTLSASGDCLYETQQGVYELLIDMSASVDDEGEVEGFVVYTMWVITSNWELDDLEAELLGHVEDGHASLEWEGIADMGGWYEDVLVMGWAELDLQ